MSTIINIGGRNNQKDQQLPFKNYSSQECMHNEESDTM